MYDLIYGGHEFLDELKDLFPTAKIENASDEIHSERVSIEVEMGEWEYYRLILLNGFGELSLNFQLLFYSQSKVERDKLLKKVEGWKEKYPEYFKKEVG